MLEEVEPKAGPGPRPRGVGPMTRAMLLFQFSKCARG